MSSELMTPEQRNEWADLEERCTHSGTMKFSALDAAHLEEYRALAVRLDNERKHQYSQGAAFSGEYFWENQDGERADKGGEFEGLLENRYAAHGATAVNDGAKKWQRHRVSWTY